MTPENNGSTLDVAALSAQLSVDRSALADQILSRLGAATSLASQASSASSKPASSKKDGKQKSQRDVQPRLPTLGLGAKPSNAGPSAQSSTARLNQDDARLKGRLTGGLKRKRELVEKQVEQGKNDKGKQIDGTEGVDEEESRATSVADGGKKKGRKDPFATQAMLKGGGKAKAQSNGAPTDEEKKGSLPAATPVGQQQLSKKARKKLNQQLKKKAEEEAGKDQDKDADADESHAAGDHSDQDVSMSAPTAADKADETPAVAPSSLFAGPSSLTSHQRSLLTKLSGGRFRQINEELYTSHSSSALKMMREDPSVMEAYHEGFREQTKGWPDIPVKVIARLIAQGVRSAESGALEKGEGKKKAKGAKGRLQISCGTGPLVVDLGAGEALLAKELVEDFAGSRGSAPRVLSYDLLDSDDGWVRGLDMGQRGAVPLPGKGSDKGGGCLARAFEASTSKGKDGGKASAEVADVAVFCLSLMGTNWVEMILEARRVLKDGATLVIAEVASRFSSVEHFVEIIESLGFQLQGKDTTNTHFSLLILSKQPSSSLLAKHGERATQLGSLQACIAADAKEEKSLIERGKEVLKPCIYKRR